MNNDLKLTIKEKLMFLFMFIMFLIVSSLDYNLITLCK
jgi:hypothetical protein